LRVTEPVIKFITVRIDEEEKRLAKVKANRGVRRSANVEHAAPAPAPAAATPAAVPATPVATAVAAPVSTAAAAPAAAEAAEPVQAV
jgi:small subunit ribosomal protein S6